MSYSDAVKEAYAHAPANKVSIFTLEVNHTDFAEPARLANNAKDFQATLEASAPQDPGAEVTFLASAFQLKLPKVEEGPTTALQITLANVETILAPYAKLAAESETDATVIFREFIVDTETGAIEGPTQDPPLQLQIQKVSISSGAVTLEARDINPGNIPFPNVYFTRDRFQGLAT
jgi:hypothetical protein